MELCAPSLRLLLSLWLLALHSDRRGPLIPLPLRRCLPSSSAIATPATTEISPTSTSQAPSVGADIPEEDQAKSRIEAKGYSNVSGLQKDDRGIWRGDATMKDGRSVVVILDLQGNIYSKLPTAEDQ